MAEIASPSMGTNTDVAFIGAYKPFAECEAAQISLCGDGMLYLA